MLKDGFTLIELVITLLIASILLTVVAPAVERLIRDTQLSTTHNSLIVSLRFARSVAIDRNQPVIVCNGEPVDGCDSDNGWDEGWYTVAVPRGQNSCSDTDGDNQCDGHGGTIIRERGDVPHGIAVTGNGALLVSRVKFQPTGFARGYAGTLSICDQSDADVNGSGIVINVTGRMRRAEPGDLNC